MIATTSQFASANAALNKKPVFLLKIPGYKRQFSTVAGLISSPEKQWAETIYDFGGLEAFNSRITFSEPIRAGDLMFVFMYYSPYETVTGIQDDAGSSWSSLYNDGLLYAWVATAASDIAAGNVVKINGSSVGFLHGGNLEIYGAVVDASFSGYHSAGASGSSSPLSVTAGSTTVTFATGVGNWDCVLVELAPAMPPYAAVTLFFVRVPAFTTVPASEVGITIDGAAAQLYGSVTCDDWITAMDPLKLTVSDLDGGSDLADLVLNVQDRGQAITADMPSYTFEGKKALFKHGFVGLSVTYWMTMFTGIINTVDSDNGNNEYKFTISSFNLKKLTAKVYTTGDDGFTTSDKHPKSLLAHPLDLLVSVLQQAGVALGAIDTNKIYYYRDTIYNGLLFQFRLSSAPTAKDFLENEICKPLGMYIWETNLGQISINSFYPAVSGNGSYTPPTPPVDTLDNDAVTLVPLVAEADLINQIATKFDDDGTGSQKFEAENIAIYNPSVTKYGMTDAHTIESQGMRSALQGYFMAAFISRLIFLRYGLKNLVLDGVPAIWSHCTLDPGDIIALTEPFLTDRKAGVLGISVQTFEVLDREWDFQSGKITLKLLALNFSIFKQYLITPNSESAYTLASPTDKAKYMFQCNDSDQYSNSDPAHTLG